MIINTKSHRGLLAIALFALLSLTIAQAQTIILQDNFPGTVGSAPNPANWTATSGITLTGSGAVKFDITGGAQTMTALSGFAASPSGSGNLSLITDYSNANSNEILGLASTGGQSIQIRSDLGGQTWKILVQSSPGVFAYYNTGIAQVTAAGEWQLLWYTNEVKAYLNGTLEFDSNVNNPTATAGGATSWSDVLPGAGVSEFPSYTSYSGSGVVLDISQVTWQSVPEPSVIFLGLMGVGIIYFFKKRTQPCDS